jgi:hypothetical protein
VPYWKRAKELAAKVQSRQLPVSPTKPPDLSQLQLSGPPGTKSAPNLGSPTKMNGFGMADRNGHQPSVQSQSQHQARPGPGAHVGRDGAQHVSAFDNRAAALKDVGGAQRRGTVTGLVNRFDGAGNVNASVSSRHSQSMSLSLSATHLQSPSGQANGIAGQRRPLPPSPTAPPDLSRILPMRSMTMPADIPGVPSVPSHNVPSQAEEEEDEENEENEDEEDEDEEDEEPGNRTNVFPAQPSPQYGILELPSRTPRQQPAPAYVSPSSGIQGKQIGGGPRAVASADAAARPAEITRQPRTAGMKPAQVFPNRPGQVQMQPQQRQAQQVSPLDLNLDDEPPVGLIRSPSPARPALPRPPTQTQPHSQHNMHHISVQARNNPQPSPPVINIESPAPLGGRDKTADIPKLSFSSEEDTTGEKYRRTPSLAINGNVPTIISSPTNDTFGVQISISGDQTSAAPSHAKSNRLKPEIFRSAGGLLCGGCDGPVVGRVVSAMGVRWHPNCFRCSECKELLEHVSSYERDGKAYCHLDYHEVRVLR